MMRSFFTYLVRRIPVLLPTLRYARRFVLTAGVPRLPLRVIEKLPHDPEAFTQGLCLVDGSLLESTGRVGSSSLRRLDPDTGQVLQVVAVDDDWAEGVAVIDDEVIQLSYKTGVARRYSWPGLQSLQPEHHYAGEGWGLANVNGRLLMSDGSARLRFLNKNFRQTGAVCVRRFGVELRRINDIAWDGQHLFANILSEPYLFRLDLAKAAVSGIVDCRPLVAMVGPESGEHVLNGICAAASSREFYLTGKCWPTLFKVRIGGNESEA